MWSHWAHFLTGPLTGYVFASGVRIKLMIATRAEMEAFTWAALSSFALGVILVAWTAGADLTLLRAFKKIGSSLDRRPKLQSAVPSATHSCWSVASVVTEPNDDPAEPLQPIKPHKRMDNLSRVSKAGAGFKQRQLQILVSNILLLLGTPFSSWWTVGALWCFKLTALVWVLVTADVNFTMEELQHTEPGFGLLIDASDLRAALNAFLGGNVYGGPLRKTRGSYYCMDDALTVSYR